VRWLAVSAQSIPVSENVGVVACYGIEHSPAVAREFLQFLVDWFQEMGYRPNKGAIYGIGREGKALPFGPWAKKLQKINYASVDGFEFYATLPHARVSWLDSYVWGHYEGNKGGTYASVAARCSIIDLGSLTTSQKTWHLLRLLKPRYGIGFSRPAQSGPSSFVFGVPCGPPGSGLTGADYEENVRISRWGDVGMPQQVYLEGLLRDVFPWNYLTGPQLAREVNGIPLKEWIRQSTGRGTLTQAGEGVSVWEVSETCIAAIRDTLRRAGVIFDWKLTRNVRKSGHSSP
jgi:hypothetical protein